MWRICVYLSAKIRSWHLPVLKSIASLHVLWEMSSNFSRTRARSLYLSSWGITEVWVMKPSISVSGRYTSALCCMQAGSGTAKIMALEISRHKKKSMDEAQKRIYLLDSKVIIALCLYAGWKWYCWNSGTGN
jgi:hypothetical protein